MSETNSQQGTPEGRKRFNDLRDFMSGKIDDQAERERIANLLEDPNSVEYHVLALTRANAAMSMGYLSDESEKN